MGCDNIKVIELMKSLFVLPYIIIYIFLFE